MRFPLEVSQYEFSLTTLHVTCSTNTYIVLCVVSSFSSSHRHWGQDAVEAWRGWLGEPVQPQSSLIFCGGFHNKIGIQYLEDNFIKFGTRVSIALTVRLTIT